MAVDPRPLGIVRATRDDIAMQMSQSITGGISAAVRMVPQRTSRMLKALGQVFNDANRDASRRAEMHNRVGRLAQRSVLQSYGQLVTARESAASQSHYRSGGSGSLGGPWTGRLAGGVLRRALGSEEFFIATPDGIGFINERMLDEEAAHWRRIAFGARGRGQGLHVAHGLRWSGVVIAALGLDVEPSPGFTIGPGFWTGEHGDRFYPLREMTVDVATSGVLRRQRKVQTRGVEGKAFLDAGIRRLVDELPRAYENYYKEIWAEFKSGTGPLMDVRGMVPPRPAGQGYMGYRLR